MAARTTTFQDRLLSWFDRSGRDLPWRRHRTLYGTWISEIMLQQTTVRTVIPYYTSFLARFPDVGALAAAGEAEVLALWSGLGYYRRARHLHRAARMVVDERGGRLPRDYAGWRSLPGVGDYAAGAIASMGLGIRVPALDANARRVLTRWAVGDPADLPAWKPARLRTWAEDLVPADRPGDWNEAVMELGALVCTAGEARCGACPLNGPCATGESGLASRIPAPVAAARSVPVRAALVVVVRDGRVLLLPPGHAGLLPGPAEVEPQRDDFSGLHHGLWSLPGTAWFPPAEAPWPVGRWGADLSLSPQEDERGEGLHSAGTFTHAITRYRITAEVFLAGSVPAEEVAAGRDFRGPGVGNHSGFEGRFHPLDDLPPVSRLVTKALEILRLTKG